MLNAEDTKLAELRLRAKTDAIFLANTVLGYDFCETPHRAMFDLFLRKDPSKRLVDLDTIKSRLILWPRGHFKTTASAVEMVQLILNYPDIRISIMSSSLKESRKRLKEVKDHFLFCDKLRKLFPELCPKKGARLGTVDYFNIPGRTRVGLREQSVFTASPRAINTGQHWDVAFVDDMVHAENSKKKEQLEKSIEDYKSFVPLRDPGGYIYVTGTRWDYSDAYGWLLEQIKKEGMTSWSVTIKTCWVTRPDGTRAVLFPEQKARDGRTVGFTVETLDDIRRQVGDDFFAKQYLNDPMQSSQVIFTDKLLLDHMKSPLDIPQRGYTIIVIDLANSTQHAADDTVMMVVRIKDGVNYLIDIGGGQLDANQKLLLLFGLLNRYRPNRVFIENDITAAYFIKLCEAFAATHGFNVLPFELLPKQNNKDAKSIRIESIQEVLIQNRLYFQSGINHWEKLRQQLRLFPRIKMHEDYADCLGMVVQAPTNYQLTPVQHDATPWFLKQIEQQNEYPDQGSGSSPLPFGIIG